MWLYTLPISVAPSLSNNTVLQLRVPAQGIAKCVERWSFVSMGEDVPSSREGRLDPRVEELVLAQL